MYHIRFLWIHILFSDIFAKFVNMYDLSMPSIEIGGIVKHKSRHGANLVDCAALYDFNYAVSTKAGRIPSKPNNLINRSPASIEHRGDQVVYSCPSVVGLHTLSSRLP
jgi:hypothetical protein